ncbi:MAG: hypothetical protein KZQ80_14555 [Candidatus Thiodiazotropha sp. (ex Monitilora ramsayi)]|nr:hypothetical protein [Candidatus Thiodiazotropha sp. (ex Monitilora ramsayi)]
MSELYDEALRMMLDSFNRLAEKLDLPEKIAINGGYTYRYKSKSIYVAMVLKLARVITGLQAIFHLNRLGLVQEQAAIQRIEDELTEDITFLSLSIIFNDSTEMHDRYLSAFFEEEFEGGKTAIESEQKRPMIPRKKIHAYINKDRGTGGDQGTGKEVSRTISKTYSGYVHAASPHIMELYYGSPPKFNLSGAWQSPLYEDHIDDMLNYFYRGILAFAFTAKAFGDDKLFSNIFSYSKEFAKKSGRAEHLTPYET